MALLTTQAEVERSIFEAIRLVLVAEGYLPDETNVLYTQDAAGEAAWKAAIAAIVVAKGFCIELFGAGGIQDKGVKAVPRIVINTKRILPGDIGNGPDMFYEPQYTGQDITGYIPKQLPPQTSVMQMDIVVVTDKVAAQRIAIAVLGKALSVRKYIQIWDSNIPTDKFLFTHVGSFGDSELEEGITEFTITYQAEDLYFTDDVPQTAVVPIADISIQPSTDPGNTYQDTINVP